jgi:hypothetical protein
MDAHILRPNKSAGVAARNPSAAAARPVLLIVGWSVGEVVALAKMPTFPDRVRPWLEQNVEYAAVGDHLNWRLDQGASHHDLHPYCGIL